MSVTSAPVLQSVLLPLVLLKLCCPLAPSQQSTNLLCFFFPEVCARNLPTQWRRRGREQKLSCSGSTDRRTISRRAEEVPATGGVATQTSAEASAGACLNWHSCCCRTVQPQARGAINQQQQCLTSPCEVLAVPSEGCERQTNSVTHKESIGQKLKPPLSGFSLPPAAVC